MTEKVNRSTGEVVDPLDERDFSAFVATSQFGTFDRDCSAALHELMDAVLERRLPGKLTVTVEMKIYDEESDALSINTGVKVTPPKYPARSDVRYRDKSGRLVADPPDQMAIFNRDLSLNDGEF